MKDLSSSIWQRLPKPIFVQAPMEDATDTVFRRVIASVAPPDLFFTEFTNVDGLASEYGKSRVEHRLKYSSVERPIIAQIWGEKPENYLKAARYIKELGFDGIDINMGCPQKDVVKKGLCAALIENHTLAEEVIRATQEGAGTLPVSVKTRIGVKNIATEEWIGFLLSLHLDALTVHGRTVKEMSKVPAHWDEVGKAVALRNSLGLSTVIIGNGDVKSYQDGLDKIAQYGVDGVMIGRGIFEDIGVFSHLPSDQREMSLDIRLGLLQKHIELWEETWEGTKNFNVMKKYVKIYIKDFAGASDMREDFMKSQSVEEMKEVLTRLQQK